MTYKPVSTKIFKKFLRATGLKHQRTSGDHEIWDYPNKSDLLRPVTFIGCDKNIPALHVNTNLKTLGIKRKDFDEIISNL